MSKLFFLSSLGPRLPVVVSLVAHAAIAVAASGATATVPRLRASTK